MQKPTLLVVDPDAGSLHLLEVALRKAGFAVETCQAGAQAQERILAAPPSAVLCEAAADGIAVCRAVRERMPRLPFMVVGLDREAAAAALQAGADEFVKKPVLLKALVQRLRALLEQSELSDGGRGEAVSGSMRDLGLVDALQALLAAKKSALVSCESYGRTGRVWVREGQVVDADLGSVEGDAALWRLLTWESGAYRVEPQPVDREARIEGGTEAALAVAMGQVEELGRASQELSLTALLAVDYARLADLLADLPDEVNGILRNFDGRRTLREVIDLSPVDDLSTVEIARRLLAQGILREQEARQQAREEKPTLVHWLSNPPPPAGQPEAPRAASRVELVRFPPLRGVRRERLRREAEEARLRVEARQPVRLSRVVELPPYQADGSDALGGARLLSPPAGETAARLASDVSVARVNGAAVEVHDAEALLASLSAPEAVETPPIAPVAPETPPPSLAAAQAAPAQAARPRRWKWYGAGGAAALAIAWSLRGQPVTQKKDAPWLEASGQRAAPQGPAKPAAQEAHPAAAAPAVAAASLAPPGPSEDRYGKALQQGEALLRRGKYRSAVGQFQRALAEKPRALPALLALGDAFLESDQPRSAVQPLEAAAQVDPRNPRAQLLLGTAWQSLGRNAQAVAAYRRYLELAPQGEFARDVRQILANQSR